MRMIRRKMRTKAKFLLEPSNVKSSRVSISEIENKLRKCENDKRILLETLQKAWLKHSMDISEIGWEALGELMGVTLAEVMGDKAFCEWTEKVCAEKVV